MTNAIERRDLTDRYDELLAAGCLSPADQARVRAGEPVPGVVVQQSSGSSGGAPLRLPKAPRETAWLIERLSWLHAAGAGTPPRRIAFVGGVSHLEAERVPGLFPSGITRSFRLDEADALCAFQPDLLMTYPSVARTLVAPRADALQGLRTLKLGGEPVLGCDRTALLLRFPDAALVEQFGSTEMPGLAFRITTRHGDSGYCLSRDRYRFRFGPPDAEGWEALEVQDLLAGRAFPIPGWFATGDEVRRAGGRVVGVRRAGDPAGPYLPAIERLLRGGLREVQLLLARGRLRYQAPPAIALPTQVWLGGRGLLSVRAPALRLRGSNKAPLVIAGPLDDERFWEPEEVR